MIDEMFPTVHVCMICEKPVCGTTFGGKHITKADVLCNDCRKELRKLLKVEEKE